MRLTRNLAPLRALFLTATLAAFSASSFAQASAAAATADLSAASDPAALAAKRLCPSPFEASGSAASLPRCGTVQQAAAELGYTPGRVRSRDPLDLFMLLAGEHLSHVDMQSKPQSIEIRRYEKFGDNTIHLVYQRKIELRPHEAVSFSGAKDGLREREELDVMIREADASKTSLWLAYDASRVRELTRYMNEKNGTDIHLPLVADEQALILADVDLSQPSPRRFDLMAPAVDNQWLVIGSPSSFEGFDPNAPTPLLSFR
jgi:hypothetical protein